MKPESFRQWLADMKSAGLIVHEGEAARLLGVSHNTLVSYKHRGAGQQTALACRALRLGLKPYA